MEEKERYEIVYFDNDTRWKIIDNKTKQEVGGIDDMIKLLNQQSKRIKGLEGKILIQLNNNADNVNFMENQRRENQQLKQELDKYKETVQELQKNNSKIFDEDLYYRVKYNELGQQLHDLPKKIVEYFYDEIRHRAILEDDYCPDHNLERKYGVRKCLLEDIRTTILKKYGGD